MELKWRSPGEIHKDKRLHSSSLETVPLLAIIARADLMSGWELECNKYPRFVVFIAALNKWRIQGENCNTEIVCWAELPNRNTVLEDFHKQG